MDNEIQLISDGDGLAVIGAAGAVELFLVSEGLPSKDLGLQRLGPALANAAGTAQLGSEIAANSGRWVKLTKESAHALRKYELMKGSHPGVSRAVITDKGKIKGIVQFVKAPGSIPTNPALLAGAAGIMAQFAMQQTMDEITDYLAVIDAKVDDVLRAQKDAVLAKMIGVNLMIEEAMTIREHTSKVNEVTWSKVQDTPGTIADTQAYALLQLDALAEKLEKKTKISELAKTSKDAESMIQEWLAVLARCFQLQDAIAVLELDRVLDASPNELDQHRLGLRAARQKRLKLISRSTERLVARMNAAAGMANKRVLLNPTTSRVVVHSSNYVATAVVDFHGLLGIERSQESLEARRWVDAATEMRDRAFETGAEGVDSAWRHGNERFDRTASSVAGKLSSWTAERALRRREDNEECDTEGADEG